MSLGKRMVILIAIMFFFGCEDKKYLSFSGYSYGDFIYLSYNSTEKIEQLFSEKGQDVRKGQKLVKMQSFTAENALSAAERKLQAETATLKNLQSGERPEELSIVLAQLDRAKSAASLAKSQLKKYQPLFSSHVISTFEWEKMQDDYRQKMAQVDELSHQLKAKKLPARQARIASQIALVELAKSQRDKAEWDLQQTILTAPQDARIYDLLYRAGERPAAGKPILSLLPPENIKIRFFINEKNLGDLHVGMKVRIFCDGCQKPLSGKINYISPQAEYTPPVIYSTERRHKLAYMAEALPNREHRHLIKLGQPVRIEVMADE